MSLEVARNRRRVREEQERGRLMRSYETFDTWEWWQLAVAGTKEIGSSDLPIHADMPHTGYYRTKRIGGGLVPVAIWKDVNGDWIGLVDGDLVDDRKVRAGWVWYAKRPVTQAEYDTAVATGTWPDVDAAAAPQPVAQTSVAPPPMGDNLPPNESEILKDQIETAKSGVARYAAIADDVTAGKAQSLRARLLELAREADKKREELKKPHFEAGKAVDLEWQPIIKDAKAGAALIASALSAFETEKWRAAEAERREADEERRRSEAKGKPAPPPYEEPAPLPTTVRGGYGRAASIKVVKVVTEVTDWNLLFAYIKDTPSLQVKMIEIAEHLVKNGHTVPGVKIEEQRRVA
jgi:hypothetical protein